MAQARSAPRRFLADLLSRKGFVGLMVVASMALSVASFYTTFKGMTQYMGVAWVTALITFGLQGTMFAMAWIISNMLGTGLRNVTLMFVTFALCAAVSIFFSFASLFSEIYTEEMRDRVNSGYVRSFYQNAVTNLDRGLERASISRHNDLIGNEDFQNWQDDVNEVISVARGAPDVLRQRSERIQQNLAVSIQSQQAKVASITAQLAVLEPGSTVDAGRLERLTEEIARTESDLAVRRRTDNQLKGEIAVLESEMEAELTGVGTTAGRGPKYRGLEQERDLKLREKTANEAQLSGLQQQLVSLTEQQATLQGGVVNVAAEKARLDAELEAAQRLLDANRQRLAESQETGRGDMSGQIDQLQRNLARAQRGPNGFGEAVTEVLSICTALYDELVSDVDLQERLQSVSCNTGPFQIQVNEVADLASRRALFQEDCSAGAEISGEAAGDFFNNSVQKVEECLSASGLPATETRNELTALIASRGPGAHPFVTAQNALFEDRLPLSYMAGFLAFVIDCLILLAALLANFVGKSKREKALRALLHVQFDENGAAFVEISDRNPMYRNMEEEANMMQLAGHGRYLRGDDGAPDRLELFSSAQEYLQREIAREAGTLDTLVPTVAPLPVQDTRNGF